MGESLSSKINRHAAHEAEDNIFFTQPQRPVKRRGTL